MRASGGHRQQRAQSQGRSVAQEGQRGGGGATHPSIDTEAGWTKSGWHGWVYGWKLHLACTVAGVWIPLSARLTPANVHDGRIAPLLIGELPEEARFVLGDKHYDAKDLKERCLADGRFLVSPKRGAYPHTDEGGRGQEDLPSLAPPGHREPKRTLQSTL